MCVCVCVQARVTSERERERQTMKERESKMTSNFFIDLLSSNFFFLRSEKKESRSTIDVSPRF